MSDYDLHNKNYVIPGFVFSTAAALYLWELAVAHGVSGMLIYGVAFGCLACAGVLGGLATIIVYSVRMQVGRLLPRNDEALFFYPIASIIGVAAASTVFLHLAGMHAAVLSTLYITLVTFASVGALTIHLVGLIYRMALFRPY